MPATGFILPATATVEAGSGTWTNQDNIKIDDGTEATFSLAVKNTSGRWVSGTGFGLDSLIPSGSTITTVEIRMDYRVNTAGGIANPEMQSFVSGVGVGAVRVASPLEPTVLTLNTFDVTADRAWTRADLLDANFALKIRGRNGNSATDPSYRWDYIAVQVTYEVLLGAGRLYVLFGPAMRRGRW
jgi:hypothetical protein